jgi:hybrid cluster-associated redox disulfide protein
MMAADKITKEKAIGEVVSKYPQTIEIFFEHGLHCVGCAASHFENIGQGCEAHGIDTDKLVDDLNKAIAKKPAQKKKQ